MPDNAEPVRVLFVCLGNICRSPSAHGVFRVALENAGLGGRVVVDSAGTDAWHAGEPPDARAAAEAAARGFEIHDLRARRVTPADLQVFDYVLAMDEANREDLYTLAERMPGRRAEIALLGAYSRRYPDEPIPDPYYGGKNGFTHALDVIEDAVAGLIATIRSRLAERGG